MVGTWFFFHSPPQLLSKIPVSHASRGDSPTRLQFRNGMRREMAHRRLAMSGLHTQHNCHWDKAQPFSLTFRSHEGPRALQGNFRDSKEKPQCKEAHRLTPKPQMPWFCLLLALPNGLTPSVWFSTSPLYPFHQIFLFFISGLAFFFPLKIRGLFVLSLQMEAILAKLIWSLQLRTPPWVSPFYMVLGLVLGKRWLRSWPWVLHLLGREIKNLQHSPPTLPPTSH